MKKLSMLCLSAAACLAMGMTPFAGHAQSAPPVPDLKGQTLRIATWANGVGHREASAAYEKATGLRVEWTVGNDPDFLAQLLASKGGEPPYDIITIGEVLEPLAIQQGLLVKPDYNNIPNAKTIAPDFVRKSGYGPIWQYSLFGLAYSPEKFKQAGIPEPTDLSVVADPRLAGHVTMPDVTQINWSGGVIQSFAAFYGNSLADPAPTLAKLSAIKNLLFYTSSNDVEARYLSGEIWAAVWTDGRINLLKTKGGIVEMAPLGIPNPKGGTFKYTAVPGLVEITNPAKKALAETYINAMLDTEFQVKYSRATLYPPANVEALKILEVDPKIGQFYKPAQDLFTPDAEAWNKYQASWVDAWGKAMRH